MKKLLKILALRSIAARLTAMAVAGAVFMVFVAVTVLLIARAELAAERTEKAHAMVDAVWNMDTPVGVPRYYAGLVDLLALIVLGGRLRVL